MYVHTSNDPRLRAWHVLHDREVRFGLICSALDIFGGSTKYEEVVTWQRGEEARDNATKSSFMFGRTPTL